MIEMIVRVVTAGVVANPVIAIGVNMGRGRVSGFTDIAGRYAGTRTHRRGAVCRDVPAADAVRSGAGTVRAAAGRVLCKRLDGKRQRHYEESGEYFHGCIRVVL